MTSRLAFMLASLAGAALLAAAGASASGGNGGSNGGGANGCAAYSNAAVDAATLTASWTVTNCSSKPENILDVLSLRDAAGNQIWLSSAGDNTVLAPGESRTGSFGGLGIPTGLTSGAVYDLHLAAWNSVTNPATGLTKIDVVGGGDALFVAP